MNEEKSVTLGGTCCECKHNKCSSSSSGSIVPLIGVLALAFFIDVYVMPRLRG
jgi:hypothetical protein